MSNVAVDTARERENHDGQNDGISVNTDGVRYRLKPVAPALMDAVQSKVPMPKVPVWHNPDMDRDEPNPNHPDYLMALEDANRQRGIAVYDALVMFGVELLDGLPQDEGWLKKLKNLAKHGVLDLGQYDLEDELDKEFVYKRFILTTGDMVDKIGNLSAMTASDVKKAGAIFPSNS